MRKIDENNVESLIRSIKELDLLHPICVAKQGDEYILLSGGHRWTAFERLGRPTIPCVVRENDELVNQFLCNKISYTDINKILIKFLNTKFVMSLYKKKPLNYKMLKINKELIRLKIKNHYNKI